MNDYKLTIGLEIHAELITKTKMFCDSPNDPSAGINQNICPVCMGYPGSLPVINKEAIRSVLRFGAAIEGDLADYTEFDRKNYFYPDIPKGYQISQYKSPLVRNGSLAGVEITRVHLEEDTARSTHDSELTVDSSLLDFNRAGVPLMELVTEPVIHDAPTAARFAKEFQLLLWCLGISGANMEKGEMRVEANISVSRDEKLGVKVEVKNLNSFKALEKAILFEEKRQIAVIESGEQVKQETRGWDENKSQTFSQRAKEESHDYRYFPDPDLPKLKLGEIPEFSLENLTASLPELPEEKRRRLKDDFGLKDSDIEIYVEDRNKGELFENVMSEIKDSTLAQIVSNYILTDIKRPLSPVVISQTIKLINEGELSSRGAKDIFNLIPEDEADVKSFATEKKLIQNSDTETLKVLVQKIISENNDAVEEYKKGKEAALQYLVGQAMKGSGGSANPIALKKIFLETL